MRETLIQEGSERPHPATRTEFAHHFVVGLAADQEKVAKDTFQPLNEFDPTIDRPILLGRTAAHVKTKRRGSEFRSDSQPWNRIMESQSKLPEHFGQLKDRGHFRMRTSVAPATTRLTPAAARFRPTTPSGSDKKLIARSNPSTLSRTSSGNGPSTKSGTRSGASSRSTRWTNSGAASRAWGKMPHNSKLEFGKPFRISRNTGRVRIRSPSAPPRRTRIFNPKRLVRYYSHL